MWVIRAGKNGMYYQSFKAGNRMYLCWPGYNYDLSKLKNTDEFKKITQTERENDSQTAISTRSSQLNYFCNEMSVGDYAFIPKEHSHSFALVQITGEYEYKSDDGPFHHSRKIKVLIDEVPSDIFTQSIRYSLGAFRTIFHVNHIEEVTAIIERNYGIDMTGEQK